MIESEGSVQTILCKPIENGKQSTKQPNKLKGLYIPLLFIILYAMVLLVYFELLINYGTGAIFTSEQSKLLAFVTSPFNPLENLLPVYGSAIVGYINNLVFTVAIIFVAIFYHHLLAESERISPQLVFWSGVGASYALSIIVWLITGTPAMGTSVIGFVMALFLVGASLFDIRIYLKIPKTERSRLKFTKFICITAALAFSLVVALSYCVGNPSYINHLVGGAFCGLLVGLTLKINKNRSQCNSVL